MVKRFEHSGEQEVSAGGVLSKVDSEGNSRGGTIDGLLIERESNGERTAFFRELVSWQFKMDLLVVVDCALDIEIVSDLEGDKALLFFPENVQGFRIGVELFNLISRSRAD